MPTLLLDAASRILLRVVDPSTQFPSRQEIKTIQDVDSQRCARLISSMTQDAAQERIADNERETFRSVDRTILALRTDWDLQSVASQTFVTRQVMETIRTPAAFQALFGSGYKPIGPFKPVPEVPKVPTKPAKPPASQGSSSQTAVSESGDQKSEQVDASKPADSSTSSSSWDDDEQDGDIDKDGDTEEVPRTATPYYLRMSGQLPGRVTSLREATKLVPYYASMIQVLILTTDVEISRNICW